jgi:hypothetical protein
MQRTHDLQAAILQMIGQTYAKLHAILTHVRAGGHAQKLTSISDRALLQKVIWKFAHKNMYAVQLTRQTS